ncbi:DUF5074 domain-containing protein [Bacteroides salyersiae]|nr:DUF5074 domain-containing protein [Bacteroides salyersiae]
MEETLNLPQGAEITCSWGAWRPTPFCASRTKNNLYWNGGSNIMEGGSNYYCYEIGTEINNLKPLFTISELEGSAPETKQTTYGTLRYDDRTDELLIMTTQSGGSTNYEHNLDTYRKWYQWRIEKDTQIETILLVPSNTDLPR